MSSGAINEKQTVFGEMMTLYVSQRISDGAILYENIFGLYGPINYIIGSSLLNLGLTYSGLKIFMIFLSVSSGLLVFLISFKLFSKFEIGLLASSIYLFLPIHYGIAPVFHPDSIAIFFILVCVYFTLFEKKLFFSIAAIFGALAFLTKIPSIPLIITPIIFFTLKKDKKIIFYFVPILIISLIFLSLTGGKSSDNTMMLVKLFLENPDLDISNEIHDILWIEGFACLLAGIGIFISFKKRQNSYLLLLFFAGIIGYLSTFIPGVGPYIFNYVEPFVAIFAAFAIFYLAKKIKSKKSVVVFTLTFILFTQFIIFDYPGRERIADWDGNGRALVLNQILEDHSKLLEKYSNPHDEVVASPMAAFMTNRILPLDDPSIDLLQIKDNMEFENTQNKLATLKPKLENKDFKILISYNSTEKNSPLNNNFQELLFYPFYKSDFKKILSEHYDEYEENGLIFYLPKD